MTTETLRAHIQMMESHGQHEYAKAARAWYWALLGPYLRGGV